MIWAIVFELDSVEWKQYYNNKFTPLMDGAICGGEQ